MAQTNILLEAGTNELEIVEFYLEENVQDPTAGGYRGHYGVNVAKVLEIIRMPRIVELPDVQHKAVRGAFNLRSHIIPLVDLSAWLGKNRAENEPPKVIVTEFNKVTTAFMVSGVNRIHRISWEEVEPPNLFVAGLSNNTVTGVVKIEGRIIFLLDLERIVADLNPQHGFSLDDAGDWGEHDNYRALIVDDSNLVREMLKDLLQKANFTVDTVTNGRDAWEKLLRIKKTAEQEQRRPNDYVQVLVSDIEMPSMDSHSLCRHVKNDPVLCNLPVVLFSSLITDKLRHKGDEVGADEQISKPEVAQLARRCIALIQQRAQA